MGDNCAATAGQCGAKHPGVLIAPPVSDAEDTAEHGVKVSGGDCRDD